MDNNIREVELKAITDKIAVRLMTVMSLIALVGCSDESGELSVVPQSETHPISFAGDMQSTQTVTRAEMSLHDKGISSFRVYGYKNMDYDDVADEYTSVQKVMDGYKVNWNPYTDDSHTNTDGWEYVIATENQTIKFWDYAALAYRFFAVAPATVSSVVGSSPDNISIELPINTSNAEAIAATPYFSDLWFSTGNLVQYPQMAFGKPVKLRFIKPIARVRFLFIYPEDNTIYNRTALSDISFAPVNGSPIAQKGTVTITYPIKGGETTYTWASSGSTEDALSAFTRDYQESIDEYWYDILPTSAPLDYRLSVKVFTDERTADVPANLMRWVPGYEYTYIFKITDNGGVLLDLLQMAIRDWTETEDSHEIYNW